MEDEDQFEDVESRSSDDVQHTLTMKELIGKHFPSFFHEKTSTMDVQVAANASGSKPKDPEQTSNESILNTLRSSWITAPTRSKCDQSLLLLASNRN